MEFQATTSSLRKICKLTALAAKTRGSHAWQARILLQASENALTAYCTDGSLEATVNIPADVAQPGKYLIDHDRLSGIIEAVSEAEMRFQLKSEKLVVNCGRRRYQLPVYDPTDYPQRYELSGGVQEISLPSMALTTLIQRTMGHADDDKIRPIHGCILVRVSPSYLSAIASSSVSGIYTEIGGDFAARSEEELAILLPFASHRTLLNLCEQHQEILLSWNVAQLQVTAGDTIYRFPIPAGIYPADGVTIAVKSKGSGPRIATFDRAEMVTAFHALRTAYRKVDGVHLHLHPDGIGIMARDDDGEGMEITDTVDVEWCEADHPDTKVKVDLDLFLLALSSPGDRMGISLQKQAVWLESLSGDYDGICINMVARKL